MTPERLHPFHFADHVPQPLLSNISMNHRLEDGSTPVDSDLTQAPSSDARTTENVGPYRLLQQVGEGGLGIVWLAEPTQPVRRQGALKIIEAGMDSAQVVSRVQARR